MTHTVLTCIGIFIFMIYLMHKHINKCRIKKDVPYYLKDFFDAETKIKNNQLKSQEYFIRNKNKLYDNRVHLTLNHLLLFVSVGVVLLISIVYANLPGNIASDGTIMFMSLSILGLPFTVYIDKWTYGRMLIWEKFKEKFKEIF